MVRRNKLAFAAASAVIASLVIGLGVSTWMFVQEKKAHQQTLDAEREQRRSTSDTGRPLELRELRRLLAGWRDAGLRQLRSHGETLECKFGRTPGHLHGPFQRGQVGGFFAGWKVLCQRG
jgi:uncharacterized protein HemX